MTQPLFTQRCGRNIATFNQSEVPKNFIKVAKYLEFCVATTGGCVLTHEISDCTRSDWDALINFATDPSAYRSL